MSIDKIYSDNDKLINLSEDLKLIENKMNDLKFNLNKKDKIAKDSLKRKNDLIVYMAHDLKTPLTSIIGYLNILTTENDLSDDFKKKYLKIVLDKSLRLENLINEFFDITRYNLNDLNLKKQYLNLSIMIEQISFEFLPLLKDKNLSFNKNIQSNVFAQLDPFHIERVLDNIIRNAINYSFKDSPIEIELKAEKSFANVKVTNKGHKIPQEKLNYIFTEFFRLDSSRSTSTGNAGLGLAISKSIIEKHNGSIEAYSDNNNFQISFKLPI